MGPDDEDPERAARKHYRRDDLLGVVTAALQRAGIDIESLATDDLAGLDQLHAGSVGATEAVLDVLSLTPDVTLLDVGSGIGGPARLAADRHGSRVVGIDLSPDFVTLARDLTARVGLASSVSFDVGSATALPYEDASFERAMLSHVGMNIADKAAVFAEVRRVLAPDGRFALFEQMRVGDGDLTFPLPWADDEQSSFVRTHDDYVQLLTAAGFAIEHDENRAAAIAAGGPPAPGDLTPADLFGDGFGDRMTNNIVATMHGILAPILIVASAR